MAHDALDSFLENHEPMPSGASFATGDMFGDWRVTAFIGRGGSGEVYRVVHFALGTEAALKVHVPRMEGEDAREARARERFMGEAKLLSENVHRSFPRFLGWGERDGRPWYVMELLEPLPLPSSDGDVARFVLGVADGVRHLHSLGLVHRDIKPGNILWRAGHEPVLIDLGLVKEVDPGLGHTGLSVTVIDGKATAAGTPRYAAPEQMNGGEITPATDVFALGMLANECFGGKPPRAWERIIRRAAAAIPSQRYQTVAAFARAVRRRNWIAWVATAIVSLSVVFMFIMAFCREEEKAVKPVPKPEIRVDNTVEAVAKPPIHTVGSRVPRDSGRAGRASLPMWDRLGERFTTNRVERVIVWTTRELGRGRTLIRALMHPAAKAFFDAKYPTNTTWDSHMPSYFAIFETNKVDVFQVKLKKRSIKLNEPIRLLPDIEYSIQGPGRLDADISGPANSFLRLNGCTVINRTKDFYPENGIQYTLENGVYLNFINVSQPSPLLNMRDVFGAYDHAFNVVRFKGPERIEELNQLLINENSAVME